MSGYTEDVDLTMPLGPNVPWCNLTATEDYENLREPAHGVRYGLWRIFRHGLIVHCHDLLSFFYSARDIYCRGLYEFGEIAGPARIIDGGAHIGLFSLYAAKHAPLASITAIEPNPVSLQFLRLNVEANGLRDRVEIVESGLASKNGVAYFAAGDSDDSSMYCGTPTLPISTLRLGIWLAKPTAVLKLNIEGAECAVLEEAEPMLRAVDKVFIEYHGFPELPQTLHRVLAVLDRRGFRYCVGAMDQETNPVCHPPFRLGQERFFNLVYAERQDTGSASSTHSERIA